MAVGFGISTPEHVKQVAGIADGVVVGSAIMNKIDTVPVDSPASDKAKALGEFIKSLTTGVQTPSSSKAESSKEDAEQVFAILPVRLSHIL